jgi:hypothetical protein
MYKIVSKSMYGIEVIDQAKDLREAKFLATEYALAFGPEFIIRIKKNGSYLRFNFYNL